MEGYSVEGPVPATQRIKSINREQRARAGRA